MESSHNLRHDKLIRYSFIWSQARLIIAAVALFAGGVPPVFLIFRSYAVYGLVSNLLAVAWLISGIASGYLLYLWLKNGKKLFGGMAAMDRYTFLISVISGLNLGLTSLLRFNPIMSISTNVAILSLVGIVYLATAWYLAKRWRAAQGRLFM